ncbi:DMT family transporter [Paracoccaceae bacterium]|nr:DMT family transporter [Paracoccaceae bacterium]
MSPKALILGLMFAFIWSSAFSSARVIVSHAPPLGALSLRFFLSGIIALIIAIWLRQNFKLTKNQLQATIIFGLCQNTIYLGLNFVAMQWIEASLAAIIASSMPLLVALLGWLFLGQRVSIIGVAGLGIGFMGVTLIMGFRLNTGISELGLIYCVLGAVALSIATLAVRNTSSEGNLMVIVGYQMLIGGASLSIFSIMLETYIIVFNWTLLVAFVYTTLVPGLIATVIWFWLVNEIGAVKAATFHFLNPFFGVSIAAVVLDEPLGVYDYLGVFIVTIGILLVQTSKESS